jgi:branched-chain amino acid transport system ATP-binding protein
MSAPAETPRRPSDVAILELRDVTASYGPFQAIFGVSFAVGLGSVVALLGANGSGKTTVARVCSGLVPISSGTMLFEGVDVTNTRAWRLPRLGIVHAPEGRSVFSTLTVDENLALALRRTHGRRELAGALEHAYELFPRLGERHKQAAGTLSGGEQRMLSLARVLVHPPKLLVVDELSLGLAPIIVDEVYEMLARIRDAGTTLLIIEQYVGHALGIADDVVVLQHGEVVFYGAATDVDDLAQRIFSSATTEDPAPRVRG